MGGLAITPRQREELVRRACAVQTRAYAPYSNYLVGASLLTATGDYFDGVNVENSSFGLTTCAERSAICAAVSAGHREFLAVAVASKGRITPCGACRQVLAEFGSACRVFLVDPVAPADILETTLEELLPGSFKFTLLGG